MLRRVGVLIKSNLFFLCVLTLTFFAAWQTIQINSLVKEVHAFSAEVDMEISRMNSLTDSTPNLYRL